MTPTKEETETHRIPIQEDQQNRKEPEGSRKSTLNTTDK